MIPTSLIRDSRFIVQGGGDSVGDVSVRKLIRVCVCTMNLFYWMKPFQNAVYSLTKIYLLIGFFFR